VTAPVASILERPGIVGADRRALDPLSAVQPGVTEIQAGGGIFGDAHDRTNYGVQHPYPTTVLSTVTSRLNPIRIVCDAGNETLRRAAAAPQPLDLDGVKTVRLSAEPVTIELETPNDDIRVGDPLEFVVGHTDRTIHLHEVMHGGRRGRVEIVWPIRGRGRSQRVIPTLGRKQP
jgi:D-serine deaminase-like pyridoxal phosphate-dependent protein